MNQLDHNARFLRENSREFYYWSLFFPFDHRGAAQALLCFDTELARIPDIVSDASLGEIRLQWWRDAINSGLNGAITGHPVADAVCNTLGRYSLPKQALLDMIDARTFDLYDDQMPDIGSLEGYLGETNGCLIRLLTILLADGRDTGPARLCGDAGVVIGIRRIFEKSFSAISKAERFIPAAVETVIDPRKPSARSTILEDIASKHLNIVIGSWAEIPDYLKSAYLPLRISRSNSGRVGRRTDSGMPIYTPLSPIKILMTLWLGQLQKRI
ncbi:MAG: phytoene/squalene synthase family protein [Hyphomicrobiales bacterium]